MSVLNYSPDQRPGLPEDVTLDSPELNYEGAEANYRIWRAPEGDAVGLFFFDIEPDLPKANTADEFWAALASTYQNQGVGSVEHSFVTIQGFTAVRSIAKIRQSPTGMAYVGSYILPFRNCSFVAKVQCEERGTTGVREAMLWSQKMSTGAVKMRQQDDEMSIEGDWNPDAPEHDPRFPNHPVSRARRTMRRIEESLVLKPELQYLDKFPLPI